MRQQCGELTLPNGKVFTWVQQHHWWWGVEKEMQDVAGCVFWWEENSEKRCEWGGDLGWTKQIQWSHESLTLVAKQSKNLFRNFRVCDQVLVLVKSPESINGQVCVFFHPSWRSIPRLRCHRLSRGCSQEVVCQTEKVADCKCHRKGPCQSTTVREQQSDDLLIDKSLWPGSIAVFSALSICCQKFIKFYACLMLSLADIQVSCTGQPSAL